MNLMEFDLRPMEFKLYLDQFVVGQEEAKITLATALCSHYKKLQYKEAMGIDNDHLPKPILLFMGPTGSGKTYMLELATKLLKVPYYITDSTQYTQAGYVGRSTEGMFQKLFDRANQIPAIAQLGIVYLDEIDKIAASSDGFGKDITGKSVQEELLRIFQGTEMYVNYREERKVEEVTLNTSDIFFILSGAFDGLQTEKKSLGYGAVTDKVPVKKALENYGFISQFLGRISFISELDELDVEQLGSILSMKNSPVIQNKQLEFGAYGIDIEFEEDALGVLAQKAIDLRMGARGLHEVIDNALYPFLYSMPSMSCRELLVTPELVQDPQKTLNYYLEQNPPKLRSEEPEKVITYTNQKDFVRKKYETRVGVYMGELKKIDIAKRFRRAAASYGIHFLLEPEKVKERIYTMQQDLRDFCREFESQYKVKLSIDPQASTELINETMLNNSMEVRSIIQGTTTCHIEDLIDVGFKMQSHIRITQEAIKEPAKYAEKMVIEGFIN